MLNKQIETENDLKESIQKILSFPFTKEAFIETDMRAFKNPTRMEAIEKATENLIENIQSECPKCQSPGFIRSGVE